MTTRVLLALFALLVTLAISFAAHAQGYPLLAESNAVAVASQISAPR